MSVQGLPAGGPEPFITRAELAERMGISTKSVDRLVAAGMPSVTFGLRTRRFKASAAIAWAQAQRKDSGSPTERSAA